MRNYLFIVLAMIVVSTGCDETISDTIPTIKDIPAQPTVDQVQFTSALNIPMFLLDEYTIGGDTIYMDLIDSSLLLNPVITQQAITTYAVKMGTRNFEFEDLYVQIDLPNRAESLGEYHLTNKQFHAMVNHFGDDDYSKFIEELLTLNAETSSKYREKSSSLLDGLNLIFGVQIEEQFSDEFPTNTPLFGYDSFQIFWKYFDECSNGSPWIGHDLIKGIYVSKGVLDQEDKLALMLIVQRYNGIFSNREEAYAAN
jgi:hypothetical protein